MSDLGYLLKKARTERGVTLDDLSESTKIQKRYLEAIEQGEFHILPGNFYVRAFIKTYSEAVGLDPTEVLRLYRNVIPSTDPEQHIEPIRRRRGVNPIKAERLGKWASSIMMVSFVVLILGIIYYFINITYDQGDGQVSPSEKLTQKFPSVQNEAGIEPLTVNSPTPQPTSPIAVLEKDKMPAPNPVVSFISTKDSTYLYSVSNSNMVHVDLKIIGDRCWLQARKSDSEGELLGAKEFQNGETHTWKDKDSIWIRLGKPFAVEVKVNGTLISIPETANPINLQINLNHT